MGNGNGTGETPLHATAAASLPFLIFHQRAAHDPTWTEALAYRVYRGVHRRAALDLRVEERELASALELAYRHPDKPHLLATEKLRRKQRPGR